MIEFPLDLDRPRDELAGLSLVACANGTLPFEIRMIMLAAQDMSVAVAVNRTLMCLQLRDLNMIIFLR